MSNAVYPDNLPGLAWPRKRTPMWKTHIKATPSGREWRSASMLTPRYRITLQYEFLRSKAALQEFQTLFGFFNARKGSFDSFLYRDPDDNSIAGQPIGVGDGSTAQFQLVRSFGGFAEPVYEVDGAPSVRLADWQGDWLLSTAARTNQALWSEDFSQAAWSTRWGGAATVTQDTSDFTAPDGSNHAAKVVATAGGSGLGQGLTLSAGVSYRFSAWVKTGGAAALVISASGSGFSAVASRAIPAGTGWARYDITYTPPSSGTYYCGVQHVAPTTLYIFGAQIDGNGAAMRYVKTTGSAGTVADYTLANGLVTLALAPSTGAALSWSGQYFWRCRFDADDLPFEQFMSQFWKTGEVKLITVKP